MTPKNQHILPRIGKSPRLLALLFILLATITMGFYVHHHTRFIPSIHDEASYLFQARTFLLGRVTNPTHPEYQFFDQYQIINEGIYTSKYFPGTALALLPFVILGLPYLGPILFYGLHLLLIFIIGKELFGSRTAWLGMILCSFSPQIVLQSCFLLSHLPDTLFLLLFFLSFLRSRKSDSPRWIFLGGISWCAAFLTRPLTAVGFALPIAVYLLYQFVKNRTSQTARTILLWSLTVLLAIVLYASYNKAVTGNWFKTPFDFYAQTHAPYHRYGFDTWSKYADQADGPRVDKRFNEYYHNHTPYLGLVFSGVRLAFFVKYLFGEISFFFIHFPVGFIIVGFWILCMRKWGFYHRLIFSIWLSVQLVYFPHWYPGILLFGSNYLYEVTGIALLAFSDLLIQSLSSISSRRWKSLTISIILIFCLVSSTFMLKDVGYMILQNKTSRFWIRQELAKRNIQKAVIFVRFAPRYDLNHDVIENVPTLNSPIIYARDRGPENAKLKPYYPHYSFYLWDFEGAKLTKLPF